MNPLDIIDAGIVSDIEAKRKSISPINVKKSLKIVEPDWRSVESQECKIRLLGEFNSLDSLKRIPTESFASEAALEIKIAPNPFAEGSCRYAYYARVLKDGEWKKYIVKQFQTSHLNFDVIRFRDQNIQSRIAEFLANTWNESSERRRVSSPNIYFSDSMTLEVVGDDGKPLFYNMEQQLECEKLMKWTNNAFWFLPDEPALLHFAKWTNKITHGYMMVTDLQGVKTADGFRLTDPAIKCRDQNRFNFERSCATNGGTAGIKYCIDSAEKALRGVRPTTSSATVRGADLSEALSRLSLSSAEPARKEPPPSYPGLFSLPAHVGLFSTPAVSAPIRMEAPVDSRGYVTLTRTPYGGGITTTISSNPPGEFTLEANGFFVFNPFASA